MTEAAQTKKKTKKAPIILGALLVIGIIIGIKEYIYYSHVETTDDAQVASNISPIVTRVSDYVTEIDFKDNQHVTQGQLLIKLDDKDLAIKGQQAEADLSTAQANVLVAQAVASSTKSMIATSQDAINTAQVALWKATQDFNRYQRMIKDGSVTQQQFDDAKAAKEAAQAQLDMAQNKYKSAKKQYQVALANLSSAQSVIQVKQTNLNYAKLQLSYADITAPVSGTASKRAVQLGQLVQAGSLLMAIVQDSAWIDADFKETQMANIKIGQHASVQIDALDGARIDGTVSSFSGGTGAVFSLLPPDNAAGNYVKVVQRVPVRVALNSKSPYYKSLRPGLSVEVTVQVK